jgi:hypothetical protein
VLRPDPAAEWERFGRDNPYYGVWANDEFRGRELDVERRTHFFASGEEHVAATLSRLRELTGASGEPQAVLDYGRGVGRLLIRLARRASRAVGVDVSPSMLAEARRNPDEVGYVGVKLLAPTVSTGSRRSSTSSTRQSCFSTSRSRRGSGSWGRSPACCARAAWARSSWRSPRGRRCGVERPQRGSRAALVRSAMQMNVYDLSRQVLILYRRGMDTVHVCAAPPAAGFQSCTLYFRR